MTVNIKLADFPEFLRSATRIYRDVGTIDTDGLHIDGQAHRLSVKCSDPQPLEGDEWLQLPEGYRTHEVYRVFTDALFKNADELDLDGFGTYKVIRVNRWAEYNELIIAASNP